MDFNKLNFKEKLVYNALKKIIDPELGVSIVDLGLIYDISVKNNGICNVKWTLTTFGCPIIDILTGSIYEAVMSVKEVKKCNVNLVYYPEWTPNMMSREARITLGITL